MTGRSTQYLVDMVDLLCLLFQDAVLLLDVDVLFLDHHLELHLEKIYRKYGKIMNRDTILIFEDNAIDREILVELFRSEYKILEAENGRQGIALLKDHIASTTCFTTSGW